MAFVDPKRSKLACPGGVAPGVDPSHPAARLLRFSAVANKGDFLSLSNGRKSSSSGGAPVYAIAGGLGETVSYGTAAADSRKFSVQSTVNDQTITLAAIYMRTGSGSLEVIYSTSDSANGYGIGLGHVSASSHNFDITVRSATSATSSITLAQNVPYFVAASANAALNVTNFVVVNLLTGATRTATAASATPSTPNGTCIVGNNNNANASASGQIAAVMHSAKFMSIRELLAWAKDPWSFWYPQQQPRTNFQDYADLGGGSTFPWAWAMNSNLPVLGTGNF